MALGQVPLLQVSTLVVTLTGVVFAWMKYFMKNDDPFSVFNHPWQPHMLAIHVVAAPILVFALGWIFQNHILAKIAMNGSAKRRFSGVMATLLIAPMVLSGYLMQTFTNETLHRAMEVTHWVSSGLFVLVYVAHLFGKKNGNGSGKNEQPRRAGWAN